MCIQGTFLDGTGVLRISPPTPKHYTPLVEVVLRIKQGVLFLKLRSIFIVKLIRITLKNTMLILR